MIGLRYSKLEYCVSNPYSWDSGKKMTITVIFLDASPEKTLCVGDIVDDIIMANSAGIKSVAISRDRRFHSEERLKEAIDRSKLDR